MNDLKADIISSPENYNFSFYTDNDYEAGDLIADPANFSCIAASTTIYAKVCDKNNASACSTADVVLTVYEKPSLPAFTITQPTLCGTATASVNFCNTITGFSYKVGSTNAIDGNDAAQSVSGLVAGSAPSIVVTNKTTGGITAGCPSTSFTCSQAVTTCPEASARMRTGSYTTEQQIVVAEPTKVTAYPNPFSNKVKFVVTSAVAGKGSLEVYNTLGQKIKSVYQGQIIAGNQSFELSLPSTQQSNLIYVLKVGDRKITGKLLHINKQ